MPTPSHDPPLPPPCSYLQQRELQEYCAREGIVLQAYASLGGQDAGKGVLEKVGGPLLEHPAVNAAAAKHGVTPAQVLLRWAVQKGIAVIPKTRSPARMEVGERGRGRGDEGWAAGGGGGAFVAQPPTHTPPPQENADVFGWSLDQDDMATLDALDRPADEGRLCWVRDPLRMMDFE